MILTTYDTDQTKVFALNYLKDGVVSNLETGELACMPFSSHSAQTRWHGFNKLRREDRQGQHIK